MYWHTKNNVITKCQGKNLTQVVSLVAETTRRQKRLSSNNLPSEWYANFKYTETKVWPTATYARSQRSQSCVNKWHENSCLYVLKLKCKCSIKMNNLEVSVVVCSLIICVLKNKSHIGFEVSVYNDQI